MILEKKYTKPLTINEAIELAELYGANGKFIAGGTDVMVNKYQENDKSIHLIDITGIDELKGVWKGKEYLHIGALTKLDDLKKHTEITNEFPSLLEAAKAVGSPLIRKTATLGGNVLCENRCIYYNQSEWWREAVGFCLKCSGDVCIATGGSKACFSEFVSDTAPALIAMHAKIKIHYAEKKEEKIISLEDIYTGDGVKPKNIDNLSLVKEIMLPLNQNFNCYFKKLRQRESLEFTALTVAVSINKDNVVRIVLAGVDPKPVLMQLNKGFDKEEVIKKMIKKARAVENDMFSRAYRREMIAVYLQNAFKEINL